jgi:P-aminobenzoate N-oxygenase AurF
MTATIPSTMPTSGPTQSGRKPVDRQELSTRLLGSAAKNFYDPAVDIDGAAPIPEGLYGLSPERSTLYGTPLGDWPSEDRRMTRTGGRSELLWRRAGLI